MHFRLVRGSSSCLVLPFLALVAHRVGSKYRGYKANHEIKQLVVTQLFSSPC